jgi:hypothetical protein
VFGIPGKENIHDEVCIGDRYRIGEAEFEVTDVDRAMARYPPRRTCPP